MKRKISGEVTIEAAIVVPVLILVVISLINFAFYVHDIIVIKSYAYSAGIENVNCELMDFSNNVKSKISKSPVIVINPVVNCYQKENDYFIEIRGTNTGNIINIGNFIEGETMVVKISKSMEREVMYMIRSIIDFVGK